MQDQRLLEGGRIRNHSIHIDDRRLISVTGVKDVDSFNEQFVQLLTEAGELRIEGADLHITKLNLDEVCCLHRLLGRGGRGLRVRLGFRLGGRRLRLLLRGGGHCSSVHDDVHKLVLAVFCE